MSELHCVECGRDYFPKQSWIHEPCRYMAGVGGRPELAVNHVPPEKRGVLTAAVLTVNSPVVNRFSKQEPVVVPPQIPNAADDRADRKAYMREYMKKKRAEKKVSA